MLSPAGSVATGGGRQSEECTSILVGGSAAQFLESLARTQKEGHMACFHVSQRTVLGETELSSPALLRPSPPSPHPGRWWGV